MRFMCKIQEYAYFCIMRCFLLFFSLSFSSLVYGQDTIVKLEGWWTMEDQHHFFEDKENLPLIFDGPDLWDMDEFYQGMVPLIGLPVQVIITARIKNDTIIAQTLDVAPEGCEEY